jgi:hypothetical protein
VKSVSSGLELNTYNDLIVGWPNWFAPIFEM